MRSLQDCRDNMLTYVSSVLKTTNEFSRIEQGYKVSGNSSLSSFSDGQLYCELSDKLVGLKVPSKYLIIAHSNERMGQEAILDKMSEATKQGIQVVHLLYRYVNSKNNPETMGPLFRRFVLDEEKAKDANYHHKPNYLKDSLKHYSQDRIENFRRTKRIERNIVPNLSGGTVLYYQPESKRLDEQIIRYKWGKVVLKGEFKGRKYETISTQIKEPLLVETIDFFTLSQLFDSQPFSGFKIGDIMGLPKIEADNPTDILIRRNIGLLEQMIAIKMKDETDSLVQRICFQLDSSRNDMLATYFEMLRSNIKTELTPELSRPKQGKVATLKKITVKSRTKEGDFHHIAERRRNDNGETTYTCSCKGYTYRKSCWAIDDILAKE